MQKEQLIQDNDYSFPYHYIPDYKVGYTQTYSWDWGLFYISALEFILNKVSECNLKSIIDIGTGDGRLVRELNIKFPEAHIVGLDYSKTAITLAKALNPNLNFLVDDIITSKQTEKFDVVTLVEVFEHIPLDSANDFSDAICKYLKYDGRVLLTVPHSNIPVKQKHFQHFSSNTLLEYFKDKFELEEIIFLDKTNYLSKIIRKTLQNEYFILNHWGIKKRLYKLYKHYCLITDEKSCGRIFIKLKMKTISA